ncbi:MAG: glycosyltransferase family 2 protein, partial [Alphaproteobacteria bacterium GM202ARS2]|nr:glycosyltransferase family 2 protein [Alphaproteobacteria bacterium GM202ARS2]
MYDPPSPKVSVIVPTYNRAPLLQQAIDSIRAQTLADWELIIVDDGSNDTTPDVVRAVTQQDSRIRFYRHTTNRGAATARNTAMKHAKGTYVAFQDDDDVSHPERLQKQADYLDKHPHVVLLYAQPVDFRGDKPPPMSVYDENHKKQISYATLMGPRAIYQQVPFRPFFVSSEDVDFCARVGEYCNRDERKTTHFEAVLQHTLYAYRVHSAHRLSRNRFCFILSLLCWVSQAHRAQGLKDPIDNAQTIDDAMDTITPQIPAYIDKYGFIKQSITSLVLIYMTLPSTASPEEQDMAAYAKRLFVSCLPFFRYASRYRPKYRSMFKSHMRKAIRHNRLDIYNNTLSLIVTYRLSPYFLVRLAPLVLFACIRH